MKNKIYDDGIIYNKNQLKDKIKAATVHINKIFSGSIEEWYENYFDRIMSVITRKGEFLDK